MNHLDFELTDPDHSDAAQEIVEDTVQGASSTLSEDEEAVKFSVKVIEALSDKVKAHNSGCQRKVTLNALKKVYRRAAGNVYAVPYQLETKNGEWAMARVNVFLRLLSGDQLPLPSDVSTTIASSSVVTEIDATEQWLPEEQDFIHAREDIKRYNLDFNFKNINQLYLEDYKSLHFECE